MRTMGNILNPEQRDALRRQAERLTLRSQWRLLLCISILRTAVTRVLPLCGAAGWWVVPVCLLPGAALYALGYRMLKRRGQVSLSACLKDHPSARWVASVLLFLALLAEGVADFTALITLFTQGVGAQGSQFALAAVAAGMLLLCLKGDGLPRGIYLLRWALLVMLACTCIGWLSHARMAHMFPVLGGGKADIMAALKAGAGMGWPLIIPLMAESPAQHRLTEPLPPVLLCVGVVACIHLAIPHELLTRWDALADSMLQTVAYQGSFVRLITLCLWMLGLFLSAGAAARLSVKMLLAPSGREMLWLNGAAVLLLALVQLTDIHALWYALKGVLPWLIVCTAAGVALGSICSRRKKQ